VKNMEPRRNWAMCKRVRLPVRSNYLPRRVSSRLLMQEESSVSRLPLIANPRPAVIWTHGFIDLGPKPRFNRTRNVSRHFAIFDPHARHEFASKIAGRFAKQRAGHGEAGKCNGLHRDYGLLHLATQPVLAVGLRARITPSALRVAHVRAPPNRAGAIPAGRGRLVLKRRALLRVVFICHLVPPHTSRSVWQSQPRC